jgi:hypothetical protein
MSLLWLCLRLSAPLFAVVGAGYAIAFLPFWRVLWTSWAPKFVVQRRAACAAFRHDERPLDAAARRRASAGGVLRRLSDRLRARTPARARALRAERRRSIRVRAGRGLALALDLPRTELRAVVLLASLSVGANVYLMSVQFQAVQGPVASSLVLFTALAALTTPILLTVLLAAG